MIGQAIESWIERGRRREVPSENGTSMLRYGNRFRFFVAINVCLYGCALTAGLITIGFATEHLLTHWLVLAAFGVLALLASISFCYVQTCRVEVCDDKVTVYCFGWTYSVCHREKIVTAYKSRVDGSLVLVSSYGRKTRVSPRLDGLKALVRWLMLCPEMVLTDSILDWMRSESPEFGIQ